MTKRLVKDWTKVIATIEDSQSCARDMRIKVENMAENIPSGTNLKHVIEGILKLQTLYSIPVDNFISGKVFNLDAISEFSLEDAFEFARVAYETEKYYLAVEWLKYVTEKYDENTEHFSYSNAMNLLSSAYFKLQRPRAALAVLDKIIEKDPENMVAKRNSKYLIKKIDEGMKESEVSSQAVKGKKAKLLQKFCSSSIEMTNRSTKYFCYYSWSSRTPELFDKPNIKAEVLSLKPLIVLYRNITSNSEQKAVAFLGYEQMQAVMYKNRYTHPQGMIGMTVQDKTHWQWVPKLQKTLDHLPISQRYPAASQLVVKNVGMDGLENEQLDQSERTRLGTFIAFLSEPAHGGGNLVFPFAKVKLSPEKGNVLFYEKTVHKQATICPVIADTQWIGVYPLYDQLHSDMCYEDLLLRPSA